MPLQGEYEPSPFAKARDQVAEYESSGGTSGTELGGRPVVIVTSTGNKSGKLRKTPLMKVEHDGVYAAVASKGGAPEHPVWFHNLVADGRVEVQDGPAKRDMVARLVSGAERDQWWARAVEAFPPYAEYAAKTDREIPVFVLEPATGTPGSGSW